jgi:NADH-quinone oxidoreductase subunit J
MVCLGVVTLVCALGVIVSVKPIHSALWLIAALLSVAGHFGLLQAPFLAVLQILVYAGAIMVLVIFVIMLLGPAADSREEPAGLLKLCSALVVGAMFGLFALGAERMAASERIDAEITAPVADVASFGRELFVDYLFVFNLSGVLLMAAIIGAVLIAREQRRPLPKGRGLRATRSADEARQLESVEMCGE